MGRARTTLKRISKEGLRKSTFKQRKKGLMKKISEFCTMCGAEACFIVYDDNNGNVEPMTWPEDPTVVHSMIEKYESQKNEKPPKTFNIEDFFENRKNMLEAEISRVKKEITKTKYPTKDQSFSNLGEEQLKAFIDILDAKIGACDRRISLLKNMHESEVMQNMAQKGATSSHPSQLNLVQNINQSQLIPTPMRQLNDTNGMTNFTNSTIQVHGACFHRTNMLANLQQSDACFSFMPNMAQESVPSSLGSQLNCMQNISTSQHNLETLKPLDSTNKLGESSTDFANQLGEFQHCVDEPIEIDDWFNQLGGGDLESVLQNIHFQSQN
ncbi:MADS-box transcription factor PHERES 1-like [Abrus precatorius]|uniref:MADS-box transcription factor PHERES 1-like n=1 Tax=Abrus precatorius TaxID=3816 RepID=A0A8B8KGZ0_ABRPR|nr:MADS-box transcription factor PHERES 1-like [Abrus precatorius]